MNVIHTVGALFGGLLPKFTFKSSGERTGKK